MTKTYEASCADPECAATFTIDADPTQLAEDDGTLVDCPECGVECEYDYDAETDTLTITPGQEFEEIEGDDSEGEDLADGDFEEDDEQ